MILAEARTRADRERFHAAARKVYAGSAQHRATEDVVVRLVIDGPTAFHGHASIRPFLILQDDRLVGRFALIVDDHQPDIVQVSFFEALPGLIGLVDGIKRKARDCHPGCSRIVFGLNGHVNYGAGILLNRFEESPVFGFPYTPAYYGDYFAELACRPIVTFRFPTAPFFAYRRKWLKRTAFADASLRTMNKRCLRDDVHLYTHLNNACFADHPFWANRQPSEDWELFHPFRFLLREENLLFIERCGEAVGFLLWYPDFNQLVKSNKALRLRDVLRFRFADPIDTFRLVQIAVLPELRGSMALGALMLTLMGFAEKRGYRWFEGGAIFEENRESMAVATNLPRKVLGHDPEPHRRFAVFEGNL